VVRATASEEAVARASPVARIVVWTDGVFCFFAAPICFLSMSSSESDSDGSSGEAVTSGDTDDLGGLLDSLKGISLHQPREDGVPVQSGVVLPPFRFAAPAVQLRDYQASLLAAVRDRFSEGHGSVLAYLPTGGGKTHVAAAECASELAAGGRCLLLVNSRTLLEQTRRAFIKVGFGSELVGLVGGSSALQLERPVQVAMIQSLHGRTLEQHARWLRRFSLLAVVDEMWGDMGRYGEIGGSAASRSPSWTRRTPPSRTRTPRSSAGWASRAACSSSCE